MSCKPDISVIIATYNRADVLRETFEHMLNVDRQGISAEFIIVDNNSSDHTKDIVEEYSKLLPLKYLFEPIAGQNCARNKALTSIALGQIVAFTDDDIVLPHNWLKVIMSTCQQWPQYDIFGGKIDIVWPNMTIPAWTHISSIRSMAFAEHDVAEQQTPYDSASGQYPFSGNFWIRREVLQDTGFFDTSITWCPDNRILATETVFFQQLADKTHLFAYTPDAPVGHRIMPEQLTIKYLIKRAYSWGRGTAYLYPLCRKQLLCKHPSLWRLIRLIAIVGLALRVILSFILLIFKKPEKIIYAVRWLGYNLETVSIAKQQLRNSNG